MPEPQRSTPLASAGPRDVSTLITPLQTDRYPDDDLDLRWYGAAFARRWVLLLCGALLGALVAVVAVTLRPVMYEGSTTLLVAPPPRAPTSEINPATFRAILENASLVSQVIAELNLSQPPHLLTTQRFLESSLNVEELRGTNVVKVKVRLRDPKVAANASRGLAQKAILLTRQLNQQEGLSVQEQLKGHVDDAATRLRRAEQDLLAYQQHAQVELLKEDTQAILGERGDMLKLIISIESEKARLQAALDEIKRQDRLLPAQRAVGAEQALRRQQL